jgi:hypothetical protein
MLPGLFAFLRRLLIRATLKRKLDEMPARSVDLGRKA